MDKEIEKLYQAGKTKLAIRQLIKKIDEHPHQLDHYLQLSTYLIEQNSVDQALELLLKAQGLVAQPSELAYNIAVCYYLQGNFKQSLLVLNDLPNTDSTLYQKALIMLKLGQYPRALAFALTIKETDERVCELLGDIWLSLGEEKKAHEAYQKILPNKRSAKVNFLLGLTILSQDRSAAEAFFANSKRLDNNYFVQAQAQYASLVKMLKEKHEQT